MPSAEKKQGETEFMLLCADGYGGTWWNEIRYGTLEECIMEAESRDGGALVFTKPHATVMRAEGRICKWFIYKCNDF